MNNIIILFIIVVVAIIVFLYKKHSENFTTSNFTNIQADAPPSQFKNMMPNGGEVTNQSYVTDLSSNYIVTTKIPVNGLCSQIAVNTDNPDYLIYLRYQGAGSDFWSKWLAINR